MPRVKVLLDRTLDVPLMVMGVVSVVAHSIEHPALGKALKLPGAVDVARGCLILAPLCSVADPPDNFDKLLASDAPLA